MTPDVNLTRVIDIVDAQRGIFVERKAYDSRAAATAPANASMLQEAFSYFPQNAMGQATINSYMLEAQGTMNTQNFGPLLQQGLRFIAFSSYNEVPTVYQDLVMTMPSNKMEEKWLKDAAMGTLGIVHEGEEYPELSPNLESDVTIKNYKRGGMIKVTEEMRRFDQTNKVAQIAVELGRSARLTREQQFFSVLTTTANYDSTTAKYENDIGNNYGTTTFSATGLLTAYRTLRTMKDPKSGIYLGVMPDTLVITPGLWFAAQQLIRSPLSMRAHADDDSTVITVETYGTGTSNPFFGFVSSIIVTPWIGSSYEWALLQRGKPIVFQEVAPLDILNIGLDPEDDCYKYRVRDWYGVGMLDDRYAYFSNSTTAPTVT